MRVEGLLASFHGRISLRARLRKMSTLAGLALIFPCLGSPGLHGESLVFLGLTNKSLVNGTLLRQTQTNLIISVGGEEMSIPRSQISWLQIKAKPVPVAVTNSPASGLVANTNQAAPSAPGLTSDHAQTEAEMRAELKTPEGQALMKKVAEQFFGTETDPRARQAADMFAKTMQDFSDGKLSVADLQRTSQAALEKMNSYKGEMLSDPQAQRWTAYKQLLENFTGTTEPKP